MLNSSSERSTTCCFSGYRPHKFPFDFSIGNKDYMQLESDIINAILKSYNEGYRTFLCGGAMGFDLICGEMVLLTKQQFPDIKLICILPFLEQAKSFPIDWSSRYQSVLERCDDKIYVSKTYSPHCFNARNKKWWIPPLA